MGLFKKKDEAAVSTAAPETAAQVEFVPEGKQESDSRICYRHLNAEFKLGRQGVVWKIYLENFKRLNELFGFDYCEELLETILDYLEKETGCTVYRYVGVEFIVILRDYTIGRAGKLADEVLERFAESWKIGDVDCMCQVSMGLCAYPGYPADAEEMLKYLNLAIARAEEVGGSQCIVYDNTLHQRNQRRRAIAGYLSTALEKHEIEVRYRPTYNVEQNRFVRAEFYMRVFVKDVGMVGSAEFVPIAEDTGQIRALEYYALDQAGAMIRSLLDQGKEFESIALLLSPILLLQSDFIDQVEKVIDTYQIPEGKLAVEIDEYAMNASYVNIVDLMEQLSNMGVELILNNFGSGYSGISKIFELPVNTLKFERLFMWQMENDEHIEPVVEGLIGIARKMGKRLIAEGVETRKQVDRLDRYGCNMRQGFFYSPTIPAEMLASVIDTSLEDSRQLLEQEREKLKR